MLRIKFFILLSCLVMQGSSLYAQADVKQIKAMEDSMVALTDSMYSAIIPDERPLYNERFVKMLVRTLKIRGSFQYPFDSLGKQINIIYPEDRSFRIFNWDISDDDLSRRYYGAVQMNAEELKLYPLLDASGGLGKDAEDSVLRKGKWYGALYYRIIPHEVDGKTVYTMFGLNAGSPLTNKKVMDPMTITADGVEFGAPIFNVRSQNKPTERINRFIIEYKKAVQASMNWDPELNAVYFDKLVSETNDEKRKYTYVPSGEYDGFRWNDGHWNYIQNLIPLDILKDGEAPTPQPYKGRE